MHWMPFAALRSKPLQVAARLPKDVPVYEVDAHNVVPVWVASDKREVRTGAHDVVHVWVASAHKVVHVWVASDKREVRTGARAHTLSSIGYTLKSIEYTQTHTRVRAHLLQHADRCKVCAGHRTRVGCTHTNSPQSTEHAHSQPLHRLASFLRALRVQWTLHHSTPGSDSVGVRWLLKAHNRSRRGTGTPREH